MNKLNENAIFTVCNVAYLNKALVLAESLYEHANVKLEVFIFDKKRKINIDSRFCNIHWAEEIKIPKFKSLSFKYTVIELTTALKPWLALNLLETKSKVIFLDPDVMAFSSLQIVFDTLNDHPVILTPHYHSPKINGLIDDEQLLRFGIYNLGFFAVDSSKEGKSFLSWWSERCLLNAFDDPQFGIFTDQKWVSIAPSFFPFIHISNHFGLNVAFWNLDERSITTSKDVEYMVDNTHKVLFIHFSAFNRSEPEKLCKRSFYKGKNSNSIVADLGYLYSNRIKKHSPAADDITYSFDYMSDGKYISPSLRRAYESISENFSIDDDPFDSTGHVAKFAQKNRLFERSNKSHISQGYDSVDNHKFKFRLVYFCMRLILRIIGPNNFMNFSRLLVFLSRYHRNRDMWKY